ncbi:MAG: hypothetical protein ABR559_01535 [Gemmatimonadota bacterium]
MHPPLMVALVALLLSHAVHPGAARAQAPVPEIVAAGIEETAFEYGRVAGRPVRLWVEVVSLPACAAGSAPIEIGFLIDADRDRATSHLDARLDLGPDARVHAACDPGSAGWTSPIGAVEVHPGGSGGPRVEIETTVDRLPSTSFYWVAYARSGSAAMVLPGPRPDGVDGPPGFAAWAILERALP